MFPSCASSFCFDVFFTVKMFLCQKYDFFYFFIVRLIFCSLIFDNNTRKNSFHLVSNRKCSIFFVCIGNENISKNLNKFEGNMQKLDQPVAKVVTHWMEKNHVELGRDFAPYFLQVAAVSYCKTTKFCAAFGDLARSNCLLYYLNVLFAFA